MTNQKQTDRDTQLGAMEYFILALVGKAGLDSLYTFQQKAGLQPGGIRPALQRLERKRLIQRAESSTRRRRNISLTPDGIEFLESSWRGSLSDYPDSESVLRAACVALMMGDSMYATMYLEGQADLRRITAEEKKMEAQGLANRRRDPLSTYAWMRTSTEAKRRSAESEAFSLLGRFLKEKYQPDAGSQP